MIHYEEYHFGEKEHLAFYQTKDLTLFAHLHRSYELTYVREGTVRVVVDGREFELKEGDYVMILPYEVHSYEYTGPSLCYVAVFSPDYVESFGKKIAGKYLENPVFGLPKDTSGLLMRTLFWESPGIFFTKAALYYVVGELLLQTALKEAGEKRSDLLHQILTDIQEHYREKMTLADLSERLGYNRTYLSRYIHETLKVSFPDLIHQHRISYAQYLLQNHGQSVSDTAFACGYENIRSFNRCFRAVTGMTPGQYRMEHNRAGSDAGR